MKRVLLLWLVVAISVLHASAQSRTVKGRVTDASDGAPLTGVSVVVKGTKSGTVTHADGSYKIEVPSNATLIFSFIGYTQVTESAGKEVVNVRLAADNKKLDEVVVTAMGLTREKKALGYNVGTVKADELVRGANPNLATAIQGKVSGVEVRPSSGMPGASAQIFIRGARFFDGNNAPLYVVDGMPINSNPDYNVTGNGVTGADFAGRSIDIDPNDIETLNVLKGQAASALYGMRAANGVIMITTKSGKGNKKGKPVISVSTNYQADQISRLPEIQSTYSQGSGGTYGHLGSLAWGPEIGTLPDNPKYGGNVGNAYNNNTPTDATRGRYWSPQKQAWVLPLAYNNPKDFFQTGNTSNTSVSLSQNGSMGNYAISFANTSQKGIVPSTGMKRYNAKFAGNFDVSPKVKIGTSFNLSTVDIDKLPSGNNSILFEIYGAPATYDMKGTPMHEEGKPYKQISYRTGTFDNPYWSNKFNSFNEKTKRFFGNAYISYDPIKDLNVRYQLGTDIYTTDMEEIYELGSAPTAGSTVDNAVPSPLVPGGGRIINRMFLNRTFNSLLNLTYNKQLSEDFKLNVLLGNEVNDNFVRRLAEEGTGFSVGGFHQLGNALSQNSTEAKFKERRVGFYGSAGLDWKKMVYLNISARNEYISTMPKGNRSFLFPSASLAWVVSELPALQDKGIYAKVRASVAQVGTAGPYSPLVYTRHTSGSGFITDGIVFPFNSVLGFRPNGILYDRDLKPQNTRSIELGAEVGVLDNRISAEYTYTKQNTINQIFAVPLAGSTGYGSQYKNGGEMSANVHEITLKLLPVKTADFDWNVNIAYTKVINKVIDLAPGVENIYLGGFTDPQVRAAIGYTYPAIYGTSFMRNSEGKMMIDDDPNSKTYGMPLAGTDKVIGLVTPDFLMDFSTGLRYKFIRVNALLAWKKGGQMYSGANRLMNLYGASKKTEGRATDQLLYEGVKASTVKDDNTGGQANDIVIKGANNFQTLYNNVLGNISEANIYGTSFLKLREVAVSVDLPRKICERTKFIKAATLSLSARNILLWTELPNFDPEASQGNGNMQGGFDYMSLPQTRSFGGGLNLTF
ncbi:SusC/RagA family TonB-linked outer membrane protein [Chitinophaga nivalis]|uniref:SusC/RagA family TonB-linked outer membrane protein n=1 Tax=Chitinophaga nivalis TaxID=2991709 RepID=A0ABT3IUE6_9BACT|nr:SusC/RagA family TonB-linked outer membrane protein [Chitinophaga nivalis]MCW3462719.1 SusC/RagA family TonB-linked outer membrane protein [Chitinophaga nivalis]MCW3487590.1 SusC/RagA family TonB-linked outer membrane protein [Chitinophaga nivalis]